MSASRRQNPGSVGAAKQRVDEVWGRVIEVLDEGEFILEVTDIDSDNEDDYDEHEHVMSERGGVEPGDFVHVWVRKREVGGILYGRVRAEEDEEQENEEPGEED